MAKGYVPTNGDLGVAARSGSLNIIRLLMRDPRIDVNANYDYAYRVAGRHRQLGAMKLLYPEIITPDADEFVLVDAAANGDPEMVEFMLMPPKVYPAEDINDAIIKAAGSGYLDIIKRLLERTPDIVSGGVVTLAANDSQALIDAAENGYVDVVTFLLKDPAVNPTAQDDEAIKRAAKEGHADIVKILLADPRVNPGMDNETLDEAVKHHHVDVVAVLLADPEKRVDPTYDDNAAIRYANEHENRAMVRLLLTDPRVRESLSPEDLATYTQNNLN